MSGKFSHKIIDHAKQSGTDALKVTLKRVIQKAAGATVDFISNKIGHKITKVLRTSQHIRSRIVRNKTWNIRLD